jgi:acetate kinase
MVAGPARLGDQCRANERNAERTSNGSNRIAVFVIATDEEQVIADEVLSVLKQKGVSRGVHP